jgi:HAD superfamily hydrolase (TIGR01450 family)
VARVRPGKSEGLTVCFQPRRGPAAYHLHVLLLVDLDGVVYRGREAVPGVPELLVRRAAGGDRVVYVTNNSRAHREQYHARLTELGLPLNENGIVTAARATAVLLADEQPRPRLAMVLGGPGLARELREAGIRVVAPTERGLAAEPDLLVVGVDFSLSYQRLSVAAEAVRRGARFVATNRDPAFPVPGRLNAGAGAIVAAIAAATNHEPDLVVGKPEPRLFQAAAEVAGVPVGEAVVIGDNLRTDVAAAHAVGARSILMLTGVSTAAELERTAAELRPTAVARDAAELEQRLRELAAQ